MTRRSHILLWILGGVLLLPGIWAYGAVAVGGAGNSHLSATMGASHSATVEETQLMSCADALPTPIGAALWCSDSNAGPLCLPALPPVSPPELGQATYATTGPVGHGLAGQTAFMLLPWPRPAHAGSVRAAHLSPRDRPPKS